MVLATKKCLTKNKEKMILAFKQRFKPVILSGSKIHTLRLDDKHRWKSGIKIHFATGVRTKYYDCFTTSKCVSVQKVILNTYLGKIEVEVDNVLLDETERKEFIKNDGFNSYESFHEWFNPLIEAEAEKEITLRLIHWTDKRY